MVTYLKNEDFSKYFPDNLLINSETGVKPSLPKDFSFNGVIDCIYKVIIEKDVFFGHSVMILTGGHDYNKFGKERILSTAGGPVTIREGVWIGSRAIIIGPCEIGRYSVIGAGAVVSKDIPEYEVWVGNPAKKMKDIIHE